MSNRERQHRAWHDGRANSEALGCSNCPDYSSCGGLRTDDAMFDCSSQCSCAEEDRDRCDRVCRLSPNNFVARVREIDGFSLDNVPRVPERLFPIFPTIVPFIEHGYSHAKPLGVPWAALPLHRLYSYKTGAPKFRSREELQAKFGLAPETRIIATGVDKDQRIEHWWKFLRTPELLTGIHKMGVELITTPNFSLFTDMPRTDNLHDIKRIALSFAESTACGIATALHVNARTDADFLAWRKFVQERSEVKAISFEFGTGAGWDSRIDWHVSELCALADAVERPLTLILRGGLRKLAILRAHFDHVVVVDTESFRRTIRRRVAEISSSGRLGWTRVRTERGEALDEQLFHNIQVVRAYVENPLSFRSHSRLADRGRSRPTTKDANREARQGSFAGQLEATLVVEVIAA